MTCANVGHFAGAAVGVEYHPPQETLERETEGTRPEKGSVSYGARRQADPPPAHEATPGGAPRFLVVQSRVDWLTMAFKVYLADDVLAIMRARIEAAGEFGRASVDLAGSTFEGRAMRTGKRLILRNLDVAIVIDPDGPEGWTVAIEAPGVSCMRHTLDELVDLGRTLARGCGFVCGERLRRLDLAADVAGWSVTTIDDRGWVKQPRARVERADAATILKEHPELRQHQRGKQITGYTICPGNPLMACIYDKREELLIRADKRDEEEDRWRSGGWDGLSPVTRVEFRLRSEALHELGARDGLDAFRRGLDAIWSYCSGLWLRLVDRESADRLSRCTVTDAWHVVQEVEFLHRAAPAARKRIRGGATAAQVFGSTLSHLGAREGLHGLIPEFVDEHGEVLDELSAARSLKEDDQIKRIGSIVSSIFRRAADFVVETLLDKSDPQEALSFVLFRAHAARARFSFCAT